MLGVTIAEHFSGVVERFPDSEAVVSRPQGRRLSYRELYGHVETLARGLLGMGFTAGDRIGIWSTNNIEWLVLQLATARIGAILININPAYRPQELAYALEKSEIQGLFTIPAFRSSDTVGKNLPHQEVKIVDVHSRQTVPLGEKGEICFRGYHIMQGYYGDDEATHRAVDGHGWLASGDLGIMDAGGYVQITGRLKEMIIRGGENIYPREIEDVLYSHPSVAEVAVFGVPDSYYGEEIMAWIKLHENESINESAIREFLRASLAHFKIPRYIWFVDDFPMTVTGKLQKYRMKEIAQQKMKVHG